MPKNSLARRKTWMINPQKPSVILHYVRNQISSELFLKICSEAANGKLLIPNLENLGMAICINWTYDCPKWFHDLNSIHVSFFLNVVCLIPVSFVHFFSKCSCLLRWEFLFREIATVHGGSNLALHATKKTLDLGQNVQFSIPCNKKTFDLFENVCNCPLYLSTPFSSRIGSWLDMSDFWAFCNLESNISDRFQFTCCHQQQKIANIFSPSLEKYFRPVVAKDLATWWWSRSSRRTIRAFLEESLGFCYS